MFEGPVNLLFDDKSPEPPSQSSSPGTSADGNEEEETDKAIFDPTGNQAKNIALVWIQGLEVDDDNNLAPKNTPEDNQAPITTNLFPGQTWGWYGIDQWELVIQTKKAWILRTMGLLMGYLGWIFFNLFPAAWLFDCCMKATSTAIIDLGD